LIRAEPEPAAAPDPPQPPAGQETVRVAAQTARAAQTTGRVINLIRLETLPPLLEERLRVLIEPIARTVTVRRILRGAQRDDAKDVFLLEGSVPNQVALTRVITLAAQAVTGQPVDEDNIRVVADEAGALAGSSVNQMGGGGGGQQAGQSLGFGGAGGAGGVFGGGGGRNRAGRLFNQIRRNIGRAKIVEAADGRILSFIQVTDLPQVRVDIRLFEINRTKLRQFSTSSAALAADFRQGALLPAGAAGAFQGSQAARVQGTPAVQNVMSFLGGTLANQLQLSAGRFAIDTVFSFLERNGLALPNGIFSSVSFEPFGVQLSVRPLVGDDDSITLDVQPQVALPSASLTASIRESTGTNPLTTALETRALRTSARLQDGQALLIGGLLTRSTSENTSGTPGLKDTPGLGWLFKSFDRTDEGLELVLVVNPVLLRDPNPEVPLWEFPPASELFPPAAPTAPGGGE
jgi:Flp pilus assembly secretin CpaC